jgi:hypothetical protein
MVPGPEQAASEWNVSHASPSGAPFSSRSQSSLCAGCAVRDTVDSISPSEFFNPLLCCLSRRRQAAVWSQRSSPQAVILLDSIV